MHKFFFFFFFHCMRTGLLCATLNTEMSFLFFNMNKMNKKFCVIALLQAVPCLCYAEVDFIFGGGVGIDCQSCKIKELQKQETSRQSGPAPDSSFDSGSRSDEETQNQNRPPADGGFDIWSSGHRGYDNSLEEDEEEGAESENLHIIKNLEEKKSLDSEDDTKKSQSGSSSYAPSSSPLPPEKSQQANNIESHSDGADEGSDSSVRDPRNNRPTSNRGRYDSDSSQYSSDDQQHGRQGNSGNNVKKGIGREGKLQVRADVFCGVGYRAEKCDVNAGVGVFVRDGHMLVYQKGRSEIGSRIDSNKGVYVFCEALAKNGGWRFGGGARVQVDWNRYLDSDKKSDDPKGKTKTTVVGVPYVKCAYAISNNMEIGVNVGYSFVLGKGVVGKQNYMETKVRGGVSVLLTFMCRV